MIASTAQPSPAASMSSPASSWSAFIFVASILLAGLAGFKAGQSTKPLAQSPSKKTDTPASTGTPSGTQQQIIDVESDDEARADGDLAAVEPNGPCKMASRDHVHVHVRVRWSRRGWRK